MAEPPQVAVMVAAYNRSSSSTATVGDDRFIADTATDQRGNPREITTEHPSPRPAGSGFESWRRTISPGQRVMAPLTSTLGDPVHGNWTEILGTGRLSEWHALHCPLGTTSRSSSASNAACGAPAAESVISTASPAASPASPRPVRRPSKHYSKAARPQRWAGRTVPRPLGSATPLTTGSGGTTSAAKTRPSTMSAVHECSGTGDISAASSSTSVNGGSSRPADCCAAMRPAPRSRKEQRWATGDGPCRRSLSASTALDSTSAVGPSSTGAVDAAGLRGVSRRHGAVCGRHEPATRSDDPDPGRARVSRQTPELRSPNRGSHRAGRIAAPGTVSASHGAGAPIQLTSTARGGCRPTRRPRRHRRCRR